MEIWVNIGSGNDLPDSTERLPESIMTSDINLRVISEKIPQPFTTKISLKITYCQTSYYKSHLGR